MIQLLWNWILVYKNHAVNYVPIQTVFKQIYKTGVLTEYHSEIHKNKLLA